MNKQVNNLSIPKRKTLTLSAEQTVPLIINGQGTINVVLAQCEPLHIEFFATDRKLGLKLTINKNQATLYKHEIVHQDFGKSVWGWEELVSVSNNDIAEQTGKLKPGLSDDLHSHYWLSIDSLAPRIIYGKGEMRPELALLTYDEGYIQATKDSENSWLHSVKTIAVNGNVNNSLSSLWRDPIVVNPPLAVKHSDQITMDDVASYEATVAANLTPACQQLYANIAGKNFQLDTPDFPEFTQAINASINDENGWCYKTLREKQFEFGETGNLDETYLRITMGVNQGDSPGIPYVMEIWPCGHYSPIHNHADANAIIRVLSGEITVRLFAMLATDVTTPFKKAKFTKDQVTWISPGLNQTHQLKNECTIQACITIQCYQYSQKNTEHYEYFDYVDDDKIEPFTPNSDMGFLQFKALMKKEWQERKSSAKKAIDSLVPVK
ncbi:cysteine dioxygenase [Pseudoalteromonas sp. T1lg65]|uniref:cysteine dioxygenase n=1 Tax=Pseudoalteromonas sp. T1lg65 TaxID=2077101 RepID=UPI003F7AB3DC